MKNIKIIASVLHYVFIIVAFGYIITALYALLNCAFEAPFFEKLANNRFAINFPFSTKHFLLGSEFSIKYVAEMVLGIALYGIFFYVLSGVFNAFMQQKLFTHHGIKNLKRFYIFNLIIYPIFVLIWYLLSVEDFPFIGMIVAHAIMGFFILFLSAIFEQGVKLQNEQDLFI